MEKIPTLDEAIELLLKLNVRILIDVKNPHPLVRPRPNSRAINRKPAVFMQVTQTLVSLFQRYKELYDRAAVVTFFPHVAYEVGRAPYIRFFWTKTVPCSAEASGPGNPDGAHLAQRLLRLPGHWHDVGPCSHLGTALSGYGVCRERRYPESLGLHLAARLLDEVHVWFLHAWLWKFTGASLVLAHRAHISE